VEYPYEETRQFSYDDPDSMKKRIRELMEILSGDTSEIDDSVYGDMWDQLEELEALTGYQLRRRGSRPRSNALTPSPKPTEKSTLQAGSLDGSLDSECKGRLRADSDARRPVEQLFNEQRSLEQLRQVNEELARQRRELEALLQRRGSPEVLADTRQRSSLAEGANDESRRHVAERDRALEDMTRSLSEQLRELQEERDLARTTAAEAVAHANDSAGKAIAEAEGRAERLAREILLLRGEAGVLEARIVALGSELQSAVDRADGARASGEAAAAVLHAREQHIIALSESVTARDAEVRRVKIELGAVRQQNEAVREDLDRARQQLRESGDLIARLQDEARAVSEDNVNLSVQLTRCSDQLEIAEQAGYLMEKAIEVALTKRQQDRLRREIRALQPLPLTPRSAPTVETEGSHG
jgi:chromosome segregation ATPase